MKEELYKKVYINIEDDLPKGEDAYFSYSRSGHCGFRRCVPNFEQRHPVFQNISGSWWLENIKWYLQPITDQDLQENLRKALSDAFEAGCDFQMGAYSEYHGGHENETPDKKEWIDEYLKKKL